MDFALFVELLAAVFGLLLGSFGNVCITRMATDESVVRPRSHCRSCGRLIAWYDNIPLLSFLALRGRCRHCRATIGWRYPIVEALTGVWFWAAAHWSTTLWDAGKWCAFGFIVITLAAIDLEERILPDEFTLGGWILGLALSVVAPPPEGVVSLLFPFPVGWLRGLMEAACASAGAWGLLWFIGWFYKQINRLWHRDIEPLGDGDPRMLGMLGAFLGLEGTVAALIIAGVSGSVLGLGWTLLNRKKVLTYELPFGTFLGAGALASAVAIWFRWLGR